MVNKMNNILGGLISTQGSNADNITSIRDYERTTNDETQRGSALTLLTNALSENNSSGAKNNEINELFKACIELKQVRDETHAKYGLFLPNYKKQQQEALTNVMNALDALIPNDHALENVNLRNALLCLLRTVDQDGVKQKLSPELQGLMQKFNFSASSLAKPQKLWLQQNNLKVTSNVIIQIKIEIKKIDALYLHGITSGDYKNPPLALICKYQELAELTIDVELRNRYTSNADSLAKVAESWADIGPQTSALKKIEIYQQLVQLVTSSTLLDKYTKIISNLQKQIASSSNQINDDEEKEGYFDLAENNLRNSLAYSESSNLENKLNEFYEEKITSDFERIIGKTSPVEELRSSTISSRENDNVENLDHNIGDMEVDKQENLSSAISNLPDNNHLDNEIIDSQNGINRSSHSNSSIENLSLNEQERKIDDEQQYVYSPQQLETIKSAIQREINKGVQPEEARDKVYRALGTIHRARGAYLKPHLDYVKRTPVNESGYKKLEYEGLHENKPHFMRHGRVVYRPLSTTSEEKLEGNFKVVSGIDDHMVELSVKNQDSSNSFLIKPLEIVDLFNDLEITHIEPLHNIQENIFVAHNRGIPLNKSDKNDISIFKKSLFDLKKLHEKGYSHSDVKASNFVIDGNDAVLIDLDLLKHVSTPISSEITGGSLGYTTWALKKKLYPKAFDFARYIDWDHPENILDAINSIQNSPQYGSIEDQFSFLLSILEQCAKILPETYYPASYKSGGVTITNDIREFLELIAKPGQCNLLIELLSDPVKFYDTYQDQYHLYDMINWGDESTSQQRFSEALEFKIDDDQNQL